jgi:hypothetical protein
MIVASFIKDSKLYFVTDTGDVWVVFQDGPGTFDLSMVGKMPVPKK